MSMNSTIAFDYTASLADATVQFNRYVPIPLLLLGMIGNVLNVFIFRRRSLRSNPCSVCFIAASVVNLFILFDGLIPRILLSFQSDPAETSNILCKLKYYVVYASSALSSWFIGLATIDRYLSSSPNALTRQLSTLRRTRWLMLALTIFSLVFFADVLVCFVANIPDEELKCNARAGTCRNYHNYSYAVLYSFGPCVIMGTFGILIIMNVRKIGTLVVPQVQTVTDTKRSVRTTKPGDRQVISMLLVQVLFLVLFSCPISIVRIYLGLTDSTNKTTLRLTQENLMVQLVIMLTFIPNIDTFYLYTLTGKTFRKELRIMIASWMNKTRIHVTNAADAR
jgi:hypothetical protein